MYTLTKALLDLCKDDKIYRVVVIGLDRSGKTTLIQRLEDICRGRTILKPPTNEYRPTMGVNVVKVEYEGIRLHFIDLGGSEVMRKLWGKYYKQGDIVLFVIEESETTRYIAARDCLECAISSGQINEKPLLLLVNSDNCPSQKKVLSVKDLFEPTIHEYYHHTQFALKRANPADRNDLKSIMSWIVTIIRSNHKT